MFSNQSCPCQSQRAHLEDSVLSLESSLGLIGKHRMTLDDDGGTFLRHSPQMPILAKLCQSKRFPNIYLI